MIFDATDQYEMHKRKAMKHNPQQEPVNYMDRTMEEVPATGVYARGTTRFGFDPRLTEAELEFNNAFYGSCWQVQRRLTPSKGRKAYTTAEVL